MGEDTSSPADDPRARALTKLRRHAPKNPAIVLKKPSNVTPWDLHAAMEGIVPKVAALRVALGWDYAHWAERLRGYRAGVASANSVQKFERGEITESRTLVPWLCMLEKFLECHPFSSEAKRQTAELLGEVRAAYKIAHELSGIEQGFMQSTTNSR